MSDVATLLRKAADIVETLPADLPQPDVQVRPWADDIQISWHLANDEKTREHQRAVANTIRRAIGGEWTKGGSGSAFWLSRKTDDLDLTIFCNREQVCRRVVTGTEEVTLPAVEARPERTEVREVVEWQCDPIVPEQVAS